MTDSFFIRNPKLSQQLQEVLERRIRDNFYPAGSLLPSESELAQEFGLSRATVRSALSVLAESGQILRRQGVGTYVSKLSQISNPINRFMEFQELIESSGFKPGVVVKGAQVTCASERDASNLSVEVNSRLLVVRKIFTADEEPVIYVITSIPEWLLPNCIDELAVRPDITEPLFDFIEKMSKRKVESLATTLWPQTVQGCIAEYDLEIANQNPETPVLVMSYIAYSDDDTPLFQSLQVYLSKKMKFSLIRRRSLSA